MVACRGIRGAITVDEDTPEQIIAATQELLKAVLEANQLPVEQLAALIFTSTPDLVSEYPAVAARQLGWTEVPLLCVQELPKQGSLPRCIRVLCLANTDRSPSEIKHVYLRGARSLRPDLG
ncbi:MAG: chorismate mutase [Bacillota bacterium]|nr:chorismate mutase [Bacillota bacterium]